MYLIKTRRHIQNPIRHKKKEKKQLSAIDYFRRKLHLRFLYFWVKNTSLETCINFWHIVFWLIFFKNFIQIFKMLKVYLLISKTTKALIFIFRLLSSFFFELLDNIKLKTFAWNLRLKITRCKSDVFQEDKEVENVI